MPGSQLDGDHGCWLGSHRTPYLPDGIGDLLDKDYGRGLAHLKNLKCLDNFPLNDTQITGGRLEALVWNYDSPSNAHRQDADLRRRSGRPEGDESPQVRRGSMALSSRRLPLRDCKDPCLLSGSIILVRRIRLLPIARRSQVRKMGDDREVGETWPKRRPAARQFGIQPLLDTRSYSDAPVASGGILGLAGRRGEGRDTWQRGCGREGPCWGISLDCDGRLIDGSAGLAIARSLTNSLRLRRPITQSRSRCRSVILHPRHD